MTTPKVTEIPRRLEPICGPDGGYYGGEVAIAQEQVPAQIGNLATTYAQQERAVAQSPEVEAHEEAARVVRVPKMAAIS